MNNFEIQKLRNDLKMTQEEFGTFLNVTSRTIQLWESGTRNISKKALKLLKEKVYNKEIEREDKEKEEKAVEFIETVFYDKDGNIVKDAAIVAYFAQNFEVFKNFQSIKPKIEIEALKIIFKAKKGGDIDIDKIC